MRRAWLDEFVLYSLFLTVTSSPHGRRHHHGSQDRRSVQQTSQEVTSLIDIPKQYESIYVRFATEPPTLPPWINTESDSRVRRSTNSSIQLRVKQSVCDSLTTWVLKTTAEDVHGNVLELAQHIDVDGLRIQQYFYETYCLEEKCACKGIDTSLYTSECESKYIFAYAKTIDSQGDRAWTLIKLRGSCNCSIKRKSDHNSRFWDDLR